MYSFFRSAAGPLPDSFNQIFAERQKHSRPSYAIPLSGTNWRRVGPGLRAWCRNWRVGHRVRFDRIVQL